MPPRRAIVLLVLPLLAALFTFAARPAVADGMPESRRFSGNVEMRVENGVRVWRPITARAMPGRTAPAPSAEGFAAHMLGGLLLAPPPVVVVKPVVSGRPVVRHWGGSAFAPAPRHRHVASAPVMRPLIAPSRAHKVYR